MRVTKRIGIRLMASFLLIIVIVSGIFSVVGIRFIGNRIVAEAQNRVEMDLNAAREIYLGYSTAVYDVVRFTAGRFYLTNAILNGDLEGAAAETQTVWALEGLDLLTVTDRNGVVLARATNPGVVGDSQAEDALVKVTLTRGEPVAASVIVPAEILRRECPHIAERAYCEFIETPRARPREEAAESAGMMLKAAAPIFDYENNIVGVLYGGLLLNRRYDVVDKIKGTVFKGEQYRGRDIGTATIFQDDIRISTNVLTEDGNRAVGTRAAEEVYERVVQGGQRWVGRAYVVNDWYISAYDPIRDIEGQVIGMLYVGILEQPYLDLKRRTSLLFLAVTLGGALLVVALSYAISRQLSIPINTLAAASRRVAAGDLDVQVEVSSGGEVAELAEAFNSMASALRRMRGDLQGWGRTLEEKVEERTKELVSMQARVAQSERLASLGMLAAGIAHEINNPLGGILTLTSLTLEDLPARDPSRSNLEEVVKQTERCKDIVKGLLEFSRQSEAGAEEVDVIECLEETLRVLERQALFFNINTVKRYAVYEQLGVTADRSQLRQVFMNIILNAVQAMEEKGTLTITARRSGEFVQVDIGDTGHGIPPDSVDRIFDPFYTTKASGEGTGLGLSIAYGIVTKHGGTISVVSEVDRGSTFTICLPIAPDYTSGSRS